ncbi:MotA/TolQ/ExbB proton channel family protein [Betaproteobacteria bacterium PRO4]|uniref:MotA/TolQ/ExbB proton channel family protein n=1 Tax=Nitrosomonas sp. TaxID=42353 RepID=UPI00256C1D78|nr:MotA/TolQ/ExbB proton channel family protein [Nitrosomonas sp.]MBE7527741.1 MotA/TolQ/ExbB proton channel family protein [Burkholderiales bacterium]MDL1867504.1 MotA/TolQ/ExbB proton channel family protein [Betaproteobacteria bacterium PRO4]
MEKTLGFSNFLTQIDHVGMCVLVLLLSLSVASWYLIVTKSISNLIASRRANAFLKHFWNIDTVPQLESEIRNMTGNHAFIQLAKTALGVSNDSQKHGLEKLAAAGGANELLTRSLRNSLDQEAARIENGLTIIASAGSAAPYIGLFGTVWGIYHALIQIGLSGQGTLDKVAGPVGEALIMTALGLAVAIPAVLAFNAFTRRNRLWMAQLDSFAHDLYTILTMGSKVGEESNQRATSKTSATASQHIPAAGLANTAAGITGGES